MKKYKVHVIPNSHTDLGYTHRQEYVYRSHARYVDYLLKIISKDKSFKWTLENYWIVENYKNKYGMKKYEELKKMIDSKNIEITGNYLNLLNIFDSDAFEKKIIEAKKEFPHLKVAIQQDVNSYSLSQALSLYGQGIKNLYISIHTHHGMIAGAGKQRGFRWNIGDNKTVNVWTGEHYMLGNEMFLNNEKPIKYTFKDSIEEKTNSHFEQGFTRLKSYLDLLDQEEYPYDSVPIVLSGKVIDNSPPNYKINDAVKKMNDKIGERAEIFISSMEDFFDDIDTKKMPIFSGEWPSWWVDGVNSTPEAVRQYREAQILYKNIRAYDENIQKISSEKLSSLEKSLTLFSEHTWGSWSSQSDPFSNGNNLLLSRKISMATDSSKIAWDLWDDIKELEGYNIVKLNEKNEYVLKNPHNEKIEKVISLDPPNNFYNELERDRFVDFEDNFEVLDENNNILKSTLSLKMGLDDNINSSIQSSKVILVNVSLKPLEKKIIKIIKKDFKYSLNTSSYRTIGVDNFNDVNYNERVDCKYLVDGIESLRYIIKWDKRGIYSIYDKKIGEELISANESIRPIRIVSKNDSRVLFGRNRQGPSASSSEGELVSHKLLTNKNNIQIVKLIFNMSGSIKTELDIRLTNLDEKIRIKLVFHKTGTQFAENLYLNLPFKKNDISVNNENSNFLVGKEQLPKTNLDYFSCFNGVELLNPKYGLNIYSQDIPLFYIGPLAHQQRFLMNVNEGEKKQRYVPRLWIMSNYWETNYKGTLEGTYSFSLDIESLSIIKTKSKLKNNYKKIIGFKVWGD